MHGKVQKLVDRHVAEANDRITVLEAQLEQYKKFDAQKADLEEVINRLTEENKQLQAELDKTISQLAELKELVEKKEMDAASKPEPEAVVAPEEPTVAPEVKESAKDEKKEPADKKAPKKGDNNK